MATILTAFKTSYLGPRVLVLLATVHENLKGDQMGILPPQLQYKSVSASYI
jgi:hypothetical protein